MTTSAAVEDQKSELTVPVDPEVERLRVLTDKVKSRLNMVLEEQGNLSILSTWIREDD